MTITEIANKLANLKSAVIFCHARPDGDTLSCAFSLYYAFLKLDIKTEIVCSSKVSKAQLDWIPFEPKQVAPQNYDGYITVDTPIPEQLGNNWNTYIKQKNTFSIDHHLSNTKYAKYFVIEHLPSCSMLVYNIIKQMGVDIDKTIANFILAGILSDTNNYSIAGLDSSVFLVTAELINYGADFSCVYDKLFCNLTKEQIAFNSKILGKINYYHDGKLAMVTINKQDLAEFGLSDDATLGLVDYLTKIQSVVVAVSILQANDNLYRISVRSKSVDCCQLAATFGGGGHKNASGAVLTGDYYDIIDKLVFTVGNYIL